VTEEMPPHDLDAEQVVLGGMMLSKDAIADVIMVLRAEDHYRPAHQVIHEVIVALWERGAPCDPVAVCAELTRRGEISRTGGAVYLHTLISSVPAAANAGYYAVIVRELALRRALVEAGQRITQIGYAPGEADVAAEQARLALDDATTRYDGGGPPGMADLLSAFVDDLETATPRGMPTGIAADLDDALTGGLVPGQLILVGARPGVGKSVCVTQAAAHAAIYRGLPVLLASLEMAHQEILARIVSAETRVPLSSLLRRSPDVRDWDRIRDGYARIAGSPLVIDYAPGCTLGRIRSRLRKMQRTGPAQLLVVDYLQLITYPSQTSSRQEAVAATARDLKNIAGEFGIPVLVASQLNRNLERRAEKRPELSDLRESGEQEAAADVVILLHRPDASDRGQRAGEMDLIIAKQRQGSLRDVTVAFQGDYARVTDLARAEHWTPSSVLRDA
jgi:replicative DNA helicase